MDDLTIEVLPLACLLDLFEEWEAFHNHAANSKSHIKMENHDYSTVVLRTYLAGLNANLHLRWEEEREIS